MHVLAPSLLALASMTLAAIVWPAGWLGAPDPALPILYYCFLHARAAMPIWAVFALGLARDVVTGTFFGFWATLYLGLQWIVDYRRPTLKGASFSVLWQEFAVYAMIFGVSAIAFGIVIDGVSPWIAPLRILDQTLTIFLYPLFYVILNTIMSEPKATLSPSRS